MGTDDHLTPSPSSSGCSAPCAASVPGGGLGAAILSRSPERKHLLSRPNQAAEPRSRASSGDQVGLLLLLLLLSCFSHVRLCATPQTAAHQAPPSLGLSRQERWSGLPFPSLVHARTHAKSLQSRLTLCDPMDRLLCPRDSLGKNPGVGCHFVLLSLPLLLLSHFSRARLCVTPWTGSSVHGIL